MNLSCPELALPLPGDLLWRRLMAHDLSHPFSSSPGEKNHEGKRSAAKPLTISFGMCKPPAGAQWLSSARPEPSHRSAQTPCMGTPYPVLGSLWKHPPTPARLPSSGIAAALGHLAEPQGFAVLASCHHLKQLPRLSPDASFQRQTVWFLYTFAFSVCQALKCLSSWSILNDNMHLYSSSSSNEWGSS